MAVAVVDTGPLVAAADSRDPDHKRCLAVLERRDLELAIPALVVTEVSQLLAARRPGGESPFLRDLAHHPVELSRPEDWVRIAELVDEYVDVPLGAVDASVVSLAERLDTRMVITLDHRHFAAVRPCHCKALELLP